MTAFEACIRAGGVAVFPADTVYGLACDPDDEAAVRRIYALKGRAPDKPAALMFFDAAAAFAALPEVRGRTRALAERLLPGAVTLLLPNPSDRFPLAGGGATLGLRVPDLPLLSGAAVAVLQTSANRTGGPDARTLDDVPLEIRDAADLVIDGGALPGTPSTVVDLRDFGTAGIWRVVREGAVPAASVAAVVADL